MTRPKPAWRPASRHGVPASCVAQPHGGRWPTVLAFLAERLPALSEADWARRLQQGDVLDDVGQPLALDAPYQPARLVWYWRWVEQEADIPFEAEVLYRDDWLVVADKPHFLPMSPVGRYARHTLLAQLQRRLGLDTLSPIHRLDRETAGVVVFAVQPTTRAAYQQLFRERAVSKVYEAVAPWRPELDWPQRRHSRIVESEQHMRMQEVPGEPNAESQIDLIEPLPAMNAGNPPLARYRLQPATGRTHQLRVHMNALGLPICGDRIYPVLQAAPAPGAALDFSQPLQLLARRIAFTDPVTGQPRQFESQRQLAQCSPTAISRPAPA
jgi:tRNA pseudouridine32 synthase/23S rRNA pseudouridine746 synthase